MTDYALSEFDVQKVAGFKVPVMKYSEIQKYNNINQLLGNKGAVILLYEWKQNMGHWCCCFKSPEGIEFFDSFGYEPDNEDDFIPVNLQKKFKLDRHLSYLLSKTDLPLHYNEFILQDKKSNTCGRWVAWRLRNRHQDLYKFVKPFEKYYEQGYQPDELIIQLTEPYLKNKK